MSNNSFAPPPTVAPSTSYSTSSSHNSSGPKRKRLVKACDACHKSKRRCDGTAPCSNCYFASKECRYTDATGRPVPAPNAAKPERFSRPTDIEQSVATSSGQIKPQSFPPIGLDTLSSAYSPRIGSEDSADLQANPRKRLRWEHDSRGLPIMPAPSQAMSSLLNPGHHQQGLEPPVMRELVNLFFAHCHPHRLIVHPFSLFADIMVDKVPLYLVNVICALAAPLSRNSQLRTTPPRFAGQPFANAARAQLFDDKGNIIVVTSLATAQALCLLQMHELSVHIAADGSVPLFDIALRILEDLDVRKPDNLALTSPPSSEMKRASLERECMRRVYWLIHSTVSLSSGIFGQNLVITTSHPHTLRLPCDETCFELSGHPSTPVLEFLHSPAPKTHTASEFGQLIRVSHIFHEIESLTADATSDLRFIFESETKLQDWVAGLAEHLVFSRDNLEQQLTLWDTSSNGTTWCFSFMHLLHAYCELLLTDVKRRHHRASTAGEAWAFDQISLILSSLGARARNSPFMGVVNKLLQYVPPGYAQPGVGSQGLKIRNELEAWVKEYESLWGSRGETWAASRRPSRVSPVGISSPAIVSTPEASQAMNPPSQYPSLTQSINDLHLQGSSATSYINKPDVDSQMDVRHWVGDAPYEATPRGRTPRLREGGPSQPLPSLKSSGLLETWVSTSDESSALAGPSRGATTATSVPSWLTSHSRTEHSTPVRRAASASAASTRQQRDHRSNSQSPSHTQTGPYNPTQAFNMHIPHPSDRSSSTLPSNLPWLAGDPGDN